ncbi:hypothetical protein ACFRFJ_16335 [Streptomyces hydrogenans]|uniref:hypothetical protein n=1 Tax=Streptomyces hydrogenans TaxID=1873719 RepID=UPI0036AE21B1
MAEKWGHMCPGEQWWQLHEWKEREHPPFGEAWGHRFSPTEEPVERDEQGEVLMPDELMERVGKNRTWARECYMTSG